MARPSGRPIRSEVLAAARELAQSQGVAEFSYADVAAAVGVKAASIHHHFPKKNDLLAEVARHYRADFNEQLAALAEHSTLMAQLRGYVALFERVAADGNMCLCGSAAAEWCSIGETVRVEVEGFFDDQVTWLAARFLEASASDDPVADARLMIATLEGATVLSRAIGSESFSTIVDRMLRPFESSTR